MASAKYSRYYTHIKPVIENKYVKSSTPYIFSLLSITFFVLFALRPTISTIINLQKNIEDNKKVLEQLTAKSQNLTTGKRNFELLSPETKGKINTALPQGSNVAFLVKSLQDSTPQQASVSALQIQPLTVFDQSSEETPFKLEEVKFSFSVQGTYTQILETLDNFRKSPRLLQIDNVNISRQGGPVILSITGKSYFLK